jgi:hypothetical protein
MNWWWMLGLEAFAVSGKCDLPVVAKRNPRVVRAVAHLVAERVAPACGSPSVSGQDLHLHEAVSLQNME